MKKLLTILLSFAYLLTQGQESILLYDTTMPNSKGLKLLDSIANERVYQVAEPRIIPFFVSKQENSGTAVLIIPGGGYARLAYVVAHSWPNGLIQLVSMRSCCFIACQTRLT
ncbi:hypothetical protein [Sphingobacterium sp. G1-14]|uniref:hypothetical protein n=1 Tax=Sphingobacterium TaxID=28453 RepID=UPI0018E05850|nr:hypothetical protein [Sphingobacterium sp. G1-14]